MKVTLTATATASGGTPVTGAVATSPGPTLVVVRVSSRRAGATATYRPERAAR